MAAKKANKTNRSKRDVEIGKLSEQHLGRMGLKGVGEIGPMIVDERIPATILQALNNAMPVVFMNEQKGEYQICGVVKSSSMLITLDITEDHYVKLKSEQSHLLDQATRSLDDLLKETIKSVSPKKRKEKGSTH